MSAAPADPPQIPDHVLLRVIGRGSYGEVWLARNVMGTLRAVKIVRRAAFDSDRPYLREFEGIRRCEPVSRAHSGLIDILHMSRRDGEDWFCYVMELADDAGQDAAEPYQPATLAARLQGGRALDVPELLRLTESLAGALAFLHEHGLIHRDVKPSNVLYAGGAPKLGDIGLVAEANSSRSFVGTEGFVPLEGPGTERADIFALGKVLYEALTGMDRSKFPRLPANWQEAYDFEQRVELNEIVMRACEGDPARRYHTAREMLADAAHIASGRSVRRMRGMERRMRVLKWVAGGVAVIAAAALGVSGIWQRQAGRERMLRGRAEQAEHSALRDQVRAARSDTSTGAVLRGLAAAREAAAAPSPELRDDAIFLLGRSDFAVLPDLTFSPLPHTRWAVDADSGLLAEIPEVNEVTGPLTIRLHTAGAPDRQRAVTVPGAPPHLTMLEFAPGGKRLLLTGRQGAGVVVDTATGLLVHPDPFPSGNGGTPLAFCGEAGDAVIRRAGGGGLAVYSLADGSRRTTPPLPDWPVRDQEGPGPRLWPSPDGRFVLLIDSDLQMNASSGLLSAFVKPAAAAPRGAACLAETATGRIVWKVSGPHEPAAAWSPDGTRIAVRHPDYLVSHDALTGKPVSVVPGRIRNHGTQLAFIGTRDYLVFSTWSMTGFCQVGCEQMLGHPPVLEHWSYGRSRRLLLAATGGAEWRPSRVLRTLPPARISSRAVFLAFSPDEDWLLSGQGPVFACWHTGHNSSEPDISIPAGTAAGVLYGAEGKTVQFLSDAGRHLAPWTDRPPEALPPAQPCGPEGTRQPANAAVTAGGEIMAFGGNGYLTVRRETGGARVFPTADTANPVALSPDGRWLAAGGFHQPDIRFFDLHSDRDDPVHVIPCGAGCYPAFSPDGRWFACSSVILNEVFALGPGPPDTWVPAAAFARRSSGLVGSISFSADGRLMAVQETASRCAFIRPGTWQVLFHLDSPLDENFERNTLSPGGRYFAAVGSRREIHLWDLAALERELRILGLGW